MFELVATVAFGKLFRRVFELVAMLGAWRTFSTPSRRTSCNLGLLEKLFDDESSSWLQLLLVGKPFQRPVLELLATLADWKTVSMTSPRAGCNLGLLENLFDDEFSI